MHLNSCHKLIILEVEDIILTELQFIQYDGLYVGLYVFHKENLV